jgi:hypothetical protein
VTHWPRALALVSLGLGCSPLPFPDLGRGPYTIINGDPRRETQVPIVGQAEWTLSRERLARMRSELPQRPYVARVQIGVVDPMTGRVYEARGAVAVSPGHAARLVLVGPAGTTALDLWVTRDRFRFSVPAIKLEKRGGADLASSRGLPIGFLRWWFLSPLEGELVLARSSTSEAAFLLRAGPATVTMRTDGERFVAIRREAGHLEGLEWLGRGLAPRTGSRGRYIEGEWGMRVNVLVEDVLTEEPDPAAFLDPDEKGTSL